MCVKYIERSYKDPEDVEAHEQMLLAATFAGVGFGNAGVHLCHGMSYPISGLNKAYQHPSYSRSYPIIVKGGEGEGKAGKLTLTDILSLGPPSLMAYL